MVSAVADWAGSYVTYSVSDARQSGALLAEHVSAFSIVFSTHPARVSARARISGGRPAALGRSFPLVVAARL